jgi:adenine-specific DNA-methyltransferase
MAKGRKRKDYADEDVVAYKHETENCNNVVSEGLASYDTSKPKSKKYEYDLHLDSQFVWAGKKGNTSFEVSTISIINMAIQERMLH